MPQRTPTWALLSLLLPLKQPSVSQEWGRAAIPENKNVPPPSLLTRPQGQISPVTACPGRLQAEVRAGETLTTATLPSYSHSPPPSGAGWQAAGDGACTLPHAGPTLSGLRWGIWGGPPETAHPGDRFGGVCSATWLRSQPQDCAAPCLGQEGLVTVLLPRGS